MSELHAHDEELTPEEAHLTRAMDYYDGGLLGADKAEFEAHLSTCDSCQHALAQARVLLPKVSELLADAPLPARPSAPAVKQVPRIRAASWMRRSPQAWRVPLALAAAVLVVLAVLWGWRTIGPGAADRNVEYLPPPPPNPPPPPPKLLPPAP